MARDALARSVPRPCYGRTADRSVCRRNHRCPASGWARFTEGSPLPVRLSSDVRFYVVGRRQFMSLCSPQSLWRQRSVSRRRVFLHSLSSPKSLRACNQYSRQSPGATRQSASCAVANMWSRSTLAAAAFSKWCQVTRCHQSTLQAEV